MSGLFDVGRINSIVRNIRSKGKAGRPPERSSHNYLASTIPERITMTGTEKRLKTLSGS